MFHIPTLETGHFWYVIYGMQINILLLHCIYHYLLLCTHLFKIVAVRTIHYIYSGHNFHIYGTHVAGEIR